MPDRTRSPSPGPRARGTSASPTVEPMRKALTNEAKDYEVKDYGYSEPNDDGWKTASSSDEEIDADKYEASLHTFDSYAGASPTNKKEAKALFRYFFCMV